MARTKVQPSPSKKYNTRSTTRNTGKAKAKVKTKVKAKDNLASLRKENTELRNLVKDHEDRLILLVKDMAAAHRFSTHALRSLTGVHLCNFEPSDLKNTIIKIRSCSQSIVSPAASSAEASSAEEAPVVPIEVQHARKPPQGGGKEPPMSPEVAMMYM